ncbi:MAG: hypothetical protein J6S50_09735 [Oscillospiraceae bacterium]|nr:hypothetical protein [Oscillospiraceae bacterium]
MTFAYAIAICANLDIPEERSKFSDEMICMAIRTILAYDSRFVAKKALINACRYLMEKAAV